MEPAAVVTIVAIVLIVLALVVFLVGVILELRKITAGLDVTIGAVGEILSKTEPVEGVVKAINADLAAGAELLEGLLEKKAGPEDAPGLVESVFPGAGVAMLERQGRAGEVKNIDVVYTRGAVQLVRLGRESPLGAGGAAGPALRDAPYSTPPRGRCTRTRPGRSPAGAHDRDRRRSGPTARPRSGERRGMTPSRASRSTARVATARTRPSTRPPRPRPRAGSRTSRT